MSGTPWRDPEARACGFHRVSEDAPPGRDLALTQATSPQDWVTFDRASATIFQMA